MKNAANLIITLEISLLIQAVFFLFAASLKTDKVTDLSYGLSFVILAFFLLLKNGPAGPAQVVLAMMVFLWGIRLVTYLLYRIVRIKRDARFDGIREHFWKFFQFWLFQGIAVWIIMLPVTVWFQTPAPWGLLMYAGSGIWLAGLAVETVADLQKFRQKSGASGVHRWMSSGLWRYSRHPNYFGELLCWWGVFLFVASDLKGWGWLSVLGPVTITYLLLYVTGIPTLEQSAEKKWGSNPEYNSYKRATNALIPWPPRSSRESDLVFKGR